MSKSKKRNRATSVRAISAPAQPVILTERHSSPELGAVTPRRLKVEPLPNGWDSLSNEPWEVSCVTAAEPTGVRGLTRTLEALRSSNESEKGGA